MLESRNQREHRKRVLKGGTVISTSSSKSEISCTLRNQTSRGAELKVPLEAAIPDEFLLYVPLDGVAYQSVVRWRDKDRIGVEFIGTAPKPRLHYG